MIDCKKLSQTIKDDCKSKLATVEEPYYLMIVQVEGDDASNAYTLGKRKDCEEIGLMYHHIILPNNCSYSDVLDVINKGNRDIYCCGIILQLPLPKHLNVYKEMLVNAIATNKDVDGFKVDSPYYPCTPLGIISVLQSVVHNINDFHCVVIGRSKLVGYPTFEMLNELNATVTLCHSHTPKDTLRKLCLSADVVICATGVPNLVTRDMVNPNTIVIDAGITRDENGKLCGDCSKDLYDYVEYITTVPNGVGLMTRAMLMYNCTKSIVKRERGR